MHAARLVVWLAQVIAEATYRARTTLLTHPSPTTRLLAERDALRQELAKVTAEADLLRARLLKLPAPRRPRYAPWMRLQVLWHRFRYGLSREEAARLFAIAPATLSQWQRDAAKPEPRLVRPRTPIRRLADAVEDLVRRLKLDQSLWGTRRIAHTLVKIGVRVSRSSVQRILRRPPRPPRRRRTPQAVRRRGGPLVAKRPGHVWLLDHMAVDFLGVRRFMVTAVLDLYSRLPVAVKAFDHPPGAVEVRRLLRRAIRLRGRPPHVVTDQGVPFKARLFLRFLRRRGIHRRYGAVGRPQAVAAIDRFFQTLQHEFLRPWMVALSARAVQRRLDRHLEWHRRYRPHQGIGGLTPAECWARRVRRPSIRPDEIAGLARFDFRGDASLPVYRVVRAA